MDTDRSELDRVYEILGNARRRAVLDYLAEHGLCDKGDLAEVIAEEFDTDRKAALTGLYQVHLPKMADTGVIDYDQRSGEVVGGPLYPTAICIMYFGRNQRGILGILLRLIVKGRAQAF